MNKIYTLLLLKSKPRQGYGLISDIEARIEKCSHCDCKIYSDGYEEDGEVFCCKHCAKSE